MGIASNRMKAEATWKKSQEKTNNAIAINEPSSSIRETRQGFRGFGAFQMKKIYSAEGVHVIDIGGPPIAGR